MFGAGSRDLGAGGLGAHGIRLVRMVGAALVIAVDLLPTAREQALAFGAGFAFDPVADGFAEALAEATAGRGIEVAFVAPVFRDSWVFDVVKSPARLEPVVIPYG